MAAFPGFGTAFPAPTVRLLQQYAAANGLSIATIDVDARQVSTPLSEGLSSHLMRVTKPLLLSSEIWTSHQTLFMSLPLVLRFACVWQLGPPPFGEGGQTCFPIRGPLSRRSLRHRQRQRQRPRQRHRHRHRQRQTETDGKTDRQIDRQTDRSTNATPVVLINATGSAKRGCL